MRKLSYIDFKEVLLSEYSKKYGRLEAIAIDLHSMGFEDLEKEVIKTMITLKNSIIYLKTSLDKQA